MDICGKTARRERNIALGERDAAYVARDEAYLSRDAAQARVAELEKKYEPPVRVRYEIPTGFESNRRRH